MRRIAAVVLVVGTMLGVAVGTAAAEPPPSTTGVSSDRWGIDPTPLGHGPRTTAPVTEPPLAAVAGARSEQALLDGVRELGRRAAEPVFLGVPTPAGDLDGDGAADVLVNSGDGRETTARSGRDGATLWSVRSQDTGITVPAPISGSAGALRLDFQRYSDGRTDLVLTGYLGSGRQDWGQHYLDGDRLVGLPLVRRAELAQDDRAVLGFFVADGLGNDPSLQVLVIDLARGALDFGIGYASDLAQPPIGTGDLDGDGAEDYLVLHYGEDPMAQAQLTAWSSVPRPNSEVRLWTTRGRVPPTLFPTVRDVGDLDGDGRDELLLNPTGDTSAQARVWLLDGPTGTVRWDRPGLDGQSVAGSGTEADVVVHRYVASRTTYRYTMTRTSTGYDVAGTARFTSTVANSVRVGERTPVRADFATGSIGDVQGDGVPDVVTYLYLAVCGTVACPADNRRSVALDGDTGGVLWTAPERTPAVPAVGGVAADVVAVNIGSSAPARLSGVDGATGSRTWTTPLDVDLAVTGLSFPPAGDLNGDGVADVVVLLLTDADTTALGVDGRTGARLWTGASSG